jgi:hypothetical protein
MNAIKFVVQHITSTPKDCTYTLETMVKIGDIDYTIRLKAQREKYNTEYELSDINIVPSKKKSTELNIMELVDFWHENADWIKLKALEYVICQDYYARKKRVKIPIDYRFLNGTCTKIKFSAAFDGEEQSTPIYIPGNGIEDISGMVYNLWIIYWDKEKLSAEQNEELENDEQLAWAIEMCARKELNLD